MTDKPVFTKRVMGCAIATLLMAKNKTNTCIGRPVRVTIYAERQTLSA